MIKQSNPIYTSIKWLVLSVFFMSLAGCSVVYQQKEIESYVVSQNDLLAKGYQFDRVSIRRFVNVEEVFSIDDEEELALLVMKNFEQGIMRTNYVSDKDLVLQRVYLFLETVLYDSFHLQAGVIAQIDPSKNDPYKTRFIDVVVDEEKLIESKNYARRIINELNIRESTQQEQIKAIHDYLVLNTEYDESLLELDISLYQDHPAFTPYGVYVTNKAVCSGYARAFIQLSAELNIPSMMVSSQNMNHAWNAVYVDGEWLFLDATWNDPVPDRKGRVLTTYYLKNLSEFKGIGHHFFDLASTQTLGIEEVLTFGEYAFAIENE